MKYIVKYRYEIIFALLSILVLVPGFYFGVLTRQVTVTASADIKAETEENMTVEETVLETTTDLTSTVSTETTSQTLTVVQVDDTPGVIVVPNLVPAGGSEEVPEFTTEEKVKGDVCSVMVSGSTVLGRSSADNYEMEGDGTLFSNYEAEIREGDTAFSILERELVLNSILVEYNITDSVRVTSVGGLREGDFGEMSGWKYKVNGIFLDVPADQYVVKAGDVVEWVYTCDGGNDVGYVEPLTETVSEENTEIVSEILTEEETEAQE